MSSTVDELDVAVERGSLAVPCVAWLPRVADCPPVVLLGHGGSGTKRSARNERLGRWFASQGVAAVAIDGPFHGDRVTHQLAPEDYQRLMIDTGVETVVEGMMRDWDAALSAVAVDGRADPRRVAYLGLSMGARFGIPLAARLGTSLRCAVFGKFGLTQSPAMPTGLNAPDRTRAAAQRISAPVLMHVQWDDELFPRAGALELFDALGSPDKTLLARPGPHSGTHQDNERTWRTFILKHLHP